MRSRGEVLEGGSDGLRRRTQLMWLMKHPDHEALHAATAHAASGAATQASRRSGIAAVPGHAEPHRPGLSALGSSSAVHRPAAAGSGRLPGPLHGHLAQPHRIRPALLPVLVRRGRPGPAGRAAAAPGAVHPVDAGDPPVQALRRLSQVLGHRRVLPDLRPGQRPGTRTRRACPPGARRVTRAGVHAPAVRGPAQRGPGAG